MIRISTCWVHGILLFRFGTARMFGCRYIESSGQKRWHRSIKVSHNTLCPLDGVVSPRYGHFMKGVYKANAFQVCAGWSATAVASLRICLTPHLPMKERNARCGFVRGHWASQVSRCFQCDCGVPAQTICSTGGVTATIDHPGGELNVPWGEPNVG